jgi:hypothetical protein
MKKSGGKSKGKRLNEKVREHIMAMAKIRKKKCEESDLVKAKNGLQRDL